MYKLTTKFAVSDKMPHAFTYLFGCFTVYGYNCINQNALPFPFQRLF